MTLRLVGGGVDTCHGGFGLLPDRAAYAMRVAAQGQTASARAGWKGDALWVTTRSLTEIMYYLSVGVELPPVHLARGVAPVVKDRAGKPIDWSSFLEGQFRIESGKDRPGHATLAVKHRDHWINRETTSGENGTAGGAASGRVGVRRQDRDVLPQRDAPRAVGQREPRHPAAVRAGIRVMIHVLARLIVVQHEEEAIPVRIHQVQPELAAPDPAA